MLLTSKGFMITSPGQTPWWSRLIYGIAVFYWVLHHWGHANVPYQSHKYFKNYQSIQGPCKEHFMKHWQFFTFVFDNAWNLFINQITFKAKRGFFTHINYVVTLNFHIHHVPTIIQSVSKYQNLYHWTKICQIGHFNKFSFGFQAGRRCPLIIKNQPK